MACTIAADAHASAHAARTLNVSDTAHLHHGKENRGLLVDEGQATGQLPGKVRVEFDVGATVYANFTIYTRNGALMGHGSGTLHESKGHSTVWVSFAGTMSVSRGTGRYLHAHGQGGFYGTFDRHNYEATIQTTGTLDY